MRAGAGSLGAWPTGRTAIHRNNRKSVSWRIARPSSGSRSDAKDLRPGYRVDMRPNDSLMCSATLTPSPSANGVLATRPPGSATPPS